MKRLFLLLSLLLAVLAAGLFLASHHYAQASIAGAFALYVSERLL